MQAQASVWLSHRSAGALLPRAQARRGRGPQEPAVLAYGVLAAAFVWRKGQARRGGACLLCSTSQGGACEYAVLVPEFRRGESKGQGLNAIKRFFSKKRGTGILALLLSTRAHRREGDLRQCMVLEAPIPFVEPVVRDLVLWNSGVLISEIRLLALLQNLRNKTLVGLKSKQVAPRVVGARVGLMIDATVVAEDQLLETMCSA
mmetsp:Transcript_16872/g.42561  ORF Transcript_16872/g.42561 Transcript_16872/m.42561 type:complete len:203 (+) Transcript_16872:630-1238(+)